LSLSPDFELFIIKSLPDKYYENCISSFISTIPIEFNLNKVRTVTESEIRELTLNNILLERDIEKDLFVVADDIVFLEGWYESLSKNYSRGEIFGFSMIDAKSGLLQDFGYDFIEIDGQLSCIGLHKNTKANETELREYRECDAVTGCAMLIKKEVFDDVHEFSIDGSNRWGEILFSSIAKKYGHRTIVLASHLRHYAISTKQNKDPQKSSISWLVERDRWSSVVQKYLKEIDSPKKITTKVSKKLMELITNSSAPLLYGAGTIADAILVSLESSDNVTVCSGLPEEEGLKIQNENIKNINLIDKLSHDNIIITSIGYEREIVDKYFSDFLSKVKYLTIEQNSDFLMIDMV